MTTTRVNKRRKLRTNPVNYHIGEQVKVQREKIQDVREQILNEIRRNDTVDKINILRSDGLVNNKELKDLIQTLDQYKKNEKKLQDVNDNLTESEDVYLKSLETIESSKLKLDQLLDKIKKENGYNDASVGPSASNLNVDDLVNFAGRLSKFIAPNVPAPQPIEHLNDFICSLYEKI